jgi:hypothetical protein
MIFLFITLNIVSCAFQTGIRNESTHELRSAFSEHVQLSVHLCIFTLNQLNNMSHFFIYAVLVPTSTHLCYWWQAIVED